VRVVIRLLVALSVVSVLQDEMLQTAALAKNPHIIVATPGRLLHHLQKSSPINLKNVQYLVCSSLAC
jgi:superfamily II DNA/RNA helicase